MATKVIKFNDGINTYVPVTVASAVQYSYNGGVMSVQDALGTVVSAVIPAAGHFGATVNLTYSKGDGLGLSGVHSDSSKKVKIDAGDGINIESITGGIKISNTATNQIQHLDVVAPTGDEPLDPTLRLDGGTNGSVQFKGSSAPTASKAFVKVSYTAANGITIEATYTDTKPASADLTIHGNQGSYVAFNSNESIARDLHINGAQGTPIETEVIGANASVNIKHKTSGVALGDYGTNSNTEIPVAPGSSKSINVPKFTVNSYGHITSAKNQTLTFDFSALTSAMHWIGVSTTDPKGASGATVNGHDVWIKGDVVSYNSKEYVLSGETNTAANWSELGDEGSHALKTISITGTDGLTGGGTISENRTISHAVPSNASEGKKDSAANNFIKSVTTDKFGHVTGYTTATFTQDHTKSGSISAGQLTYWNNATTHTAVTTSYGDSTSKYVYVDKGVLKEGTLPTFTNSNDFSVIAAGTDATGVTAGTVNTGSATADKVGDTLTVQGGNKWITTGVSDTSNADALFVNHALSGVRAQNTSDVYSIKFDDAGHITAAAAAATGTVGLTSLKYKVGNDVTDINDAALGLTFGSALVDIATLTGDTTFVK